MYCYVYATDETGSRSDVWFYYQVGTLLLLTSLAQWQYSTIYLSLSLSLTICISPLLSSSTTNFLLSYLLPRTYLQLLRVTSS
jgi:hypothetical protein